MMDYAKTLNDKEGCAEGEPPPLTTWDTCPPLFPLQTEIAHGEQG